jgi:hypothetical protein
MDPGSAAVKNIIPLRTLSIGLISLVLSRIGVLFNILHGIPISQFPIRRQCHQVCSGTLSTLHRALKYLQARRPTVESCSLKLEERNTIQFLYLSDKVRDEHIIRGCVNTSLVLRMENDFILIEVRTPARTPSNRRFTYLAF